jgi:hypothetical protein
MRALHAARYASCEEHVYVCCKQLPKPDLMHNVPALQMPAPISYSRLASTLARLWNPLFMKLAAALSAGPFRTPCIRILSMVRHADLQVMLPIPCMGGMAGTDILSKACDPSWYSPMLVSQHLPVCSMSTFAPMCC